MRPEQAPGPKPETLETEHGSPPSRDTMKSKTARQAIKPTVTKAAAGARWTYGKRGYALAQCLGQLKRHKIASATTLMVLGITLALPTLLLFGSGTLKQLSLRSLEGETLTVYLSTKTTDLQGAELSQRLPSNPGIRTTRYISKGEALQLFQEKSDLGAALDALGANPLPGAIVVYPDSAILSANRIEALATELRALPAVDRVQFDLRWVKRLKAIVALVTLVGGLLAGFLTLTALLVIGNTIRLELLRRRQEWEVARLLGASNGFMNRPILYTGALYGLLGGLIACAIALIVFNAIRQPADDLSSLYESSFQLFMPNFSQIFSVLGISIVLGVAGAISSLYRPASRLAHRGISP